MNKEAAKPKARRGGRPSAAEAGMIEDKILDTSAALFFAQGYGAVSIEEIVRQAQISKRTLYARYQNKQALFGAVVERVVHKMRPDGDSTDKLFQGANVEEVLRRIAPILLKASLSPEGLALQRLMLSEAMRFPELAKIMHEHGARREAIQRIATLLRRNEKPGKKSSVSPEYAAEQFMFMVTAAPQRRALGLGAPMKSGELGDWANDAVSLFLNGYRA
jgi:AcrR family transcriptional regulator